MDNYFKIIFLLVVLSIHSCKMSNGSKNKNGVGNDISISKKDYSLSLDSLVESNSRSLIEYFSSKKERIPDSLCLRYFDLHLGDDYKSCIALEFREIRDFKAYIVKQKCFAGGVCEFNYLYILDNEDSLISKLIVGKRLYDMAEEIDMVHKFISDTLLETITTEKTFDNNDNLSNENIDYHYYFIANYGQIKEIPIVYSSQRKFPQSSQRILTKSELLKLPKEEIDIMRNEIFADHGYKFKHKKWREYFMEKSWYHPRFDKVDDKLTIIEKINIQLILEANKKK